jgi:Na+/proline symporter
VTTTPEVDQRLTRLRGYNLAMGALHAAQAAVILVLANDFALPVTAAYLQGPPGTDPELTTLYDARLAWGVATFLALSALAHWLVAAPGLYPRYVANLRRRRNPARWLEYSVSASVMIVLIAQLTGISDAGALIALFGVNASMILFGWLQEHYEEPGSGGWLPFVFGCIAGAVPWLVVVLYVVAPGSPGDASPPGFVYGIIVSLFVLFNVFAVNQLLQYKQVGRWRGYLFGEYVYVALSLVAKSLLAWQVFAGSLAG